MKQYLKNMDFSMLYIITKVIMKLHNELYNRQKLTIKSHNKLLTNVQKCPIEFNVFQWHEIIFSLIALVFMRRNSDRWS